MQGYSYRLRLINAIAIECPVVVTIDRHEMIAIATDGRPAKPVSAKNVQLYPGRLFSNEKLDNSAELECPGFYDHRLKRKYYSSD